MTATDPETWDRFVESGDPSSYLQLSGWAAVKAVNGWSAHRLVAEAGEEPGAPGGAGVRRIGAQILVRRPRPMPWGFAYAPRGPVATTWDGDTIEAFSAEARRALPGVAGRVSHLRS